MTHRYTRPRRSRPRAALIDNEKPSAVKLRAVLEANASLLDEETLAEMSGRPRTRGDCVDGLRPCPWGCRHSLLIDVTPSGSIKINSPDLELEEMKDTCALDVADRGEQTLETIGELMNLTRERVRQIESRAKDKLRRSAKLRSHLN